VTENLQIASADDIARRTEHRDLAEKARDIIDRMPEQQRMVVIMKDIEDMTYDEMAGVTGLTVPNLRTLLSRGRKALRQFITGLDRGR
ncbi:MAG: sigma-70 region 4 domain-containing protein, partial [Bacteroidales bacterium]|nr:sigma-70 region 4 domain-containing protein [Bacteroidales bacterium]